MNALFRYLFYPCACALAVMIVSASAEADRLMRLAAEMQSLSGATRLAWASVLERLSFSWYTGATELADAYRHIVTQASVAAEQASTCSLGLAALAVVHLIVVAVSARRARAVLAWHVNLVAALAFVIGIVAPMLTVIAYSRVPVLGEVVLRHETKSILSTIEHLLHGGDGLLALVIAAFSIAVPVLKLLIVFVVLLPLVAHLHEPGMRALRMIGKWSMADVFVVAVLVAYLALDKDVYSTASVGLGLYFFTAYCALAMVAAQLASTADVARSESVA